MEIPSSSGTMFGVDNEDIVHHFSFSKIKNETNSCFAIRSQPKVSRAKCVHLIFTECQNIFNSKAMIKKVTRMNCDFCNDACFLFIKILYAFYQITCRTSSKSPTKSIHNCSLLVFQPACVAISSPCFATRGFTAPVGTILKVTFVRFFTNLFKFSSYRI